MKRAKEKKQQNLPELVHENDAKEDENATLTEQDQDIKLLDQYTPYLVIRTSGKIRSFDFGPGDASMKGGIQVQKLIFIIARA